MNKGIPEIKTIDALTVTPPETTLLDNQTPVYAFTKTLHDITMVKWVYPGGRLYETKPLEASMTAELLTAGTDRYSASEIAEFLDYHGATFEVKTDNDFATATLWCINDHIDKLIPFVFELLTSSCFPAEEFDISVQRRLESLKINSLQVDYIAQTRFKSAVFGANHPYGYYSDEKKYHDLHPEDLRRFHEKIYTPPPLFIVTAGNAFDDLIHLLHKYFNMSSPKEHNRTKRNDEINPSPTKKQRFEVPNAVQAAIRIGNATITSQHPDIHRLFFVNVLLGGYFGSRLMSNIREQKGYTYGIYSVLRSYLQSGIFYITTETGKEVRQNAIDEIYRELYRLQTEPVPEAELKLVRQYTLGSLLRSVDGPYRTANVFTNIRSDGHDIDYLYRKIEAVKSISQEAIMETAKRYLDPGNMYEIIAE